MKQRMKKIWSCAILSAALLLTGCNNEESLLGGEEPQAEKGKLSFIIPLGSQKTVTYATVPGEDDEYRLDNLYIFWFTDEGPGYKLYQTLAYGPGTNQEVQVGNGNLTSSGPSTVATISTGTVSFPSRFYLVANIGVSANPVQAGSVINTTTGTSAAAFEAALYATELDEDPAGSGNLALIKTPLPMSVLNASPTAGGYVEVQRPDLGGTISDVHLKRRVARFDVINNADYSNFEVSRILITRAQTSGWLHDKAFASTDAYATVTGSAVVDASRTSAHNANGTQSSGVDDKDATGAAVTGGDGMIDDFQNGEAMDDDAFKYELNKQIFYLWPTTLKANNAGDPTEGTEIVLEGRFYGGLTKLYKLDLATDVNIDANKIYRIFIERATEQKLKFQLIVDDWNDVDTLKTAAQGNMMTWSESSFEASTGETFDLNSVPSTAYEYASSATAPVTLTIKTKGLNLTSGTSAADRRRAVVQIVPDATAVYEPSDLAAMQASVITASTTTTYGAFYETVHTITLAPTDAPINTILRIANPANAQDKVDIPLFSNNYAKTGYKPVKVGNLLWAPVNVGATNLPAGTAAQKPSITNDSVGRTITGDHYQWGRNVAFKPFPTNLVEAAVTGPKTAAEAAGLTAFIKVTNGHWLSPVDGALWSGANAHGPCPTGWRVPTNDEWIALNAAMTAITASNQWIPYKITATSDTLFLQNNGMRTGSAASLSNYPGQGGTMSMLYWTSTVNASNVPYRVWRNINSGNALDFSAGDSPSNGYAIRAVRDVPAVAP